MKTKHNHPMLEKPVIRWLPETQMFTREDENGFDVVISSEVAAAHWEALDSDWTQGAYNEMALRSMKV